MSIRENEIGKVGLKKFGLLGYEIGGWGSALAFILASMSLIWQGWQFLIGPNVKSLPINSVELARSGRLNTDEDYLILVVDRVGFANYGAPGYDSAVKLDSATINFVDSQEDVVRTVQLKPQYFSERTLTRISQVPASMLYVKGGAIADAEVEYYPRYIVSDDGLVDRGNFMSFAEFKEMIGKSEGKERIIYMDIELMSETLGRNFGELKRSCRTIVDDLMRQNSKDEEVGTFPRDCA